MFTLLTNLKISEIDVNFIRYDHSGENDPSKTHAKQMDTTSSLSSQIQELTNRNHPKDRGKWRMTIKK
jgi:hypothetical protein